MMKRFRLLITMALLSVLLTLPLTAFAKNQNVIDKADLLSESEEDRLQEQIDKATDKINMDLVVLTIDDAKGKSAMEYADDYYDSHGFGFGDDYSGALVLIDMDNRELYVSTSGDMIDKLTDSRIERVLDAGYDDLVDGEYYECFESCLAKITDYARGPHLTVVDVWLALLIGLLSGSAVFKSVFASYKKKSAGVKYPYKERTTANFTVRQDRFINSVVTRRKIQTSSGGGGGHSSTHTSSSGRSHGGGGRHF